MRQQLDCGTAEMQQGIRELQQSTAQLLDNVRSSVIAQRAMLADIVEIDHTFDRIIEITGGDRQDRGKSAYIEALGLMMATKT